MGLRITPTFRLSDVKKKLLADQKMINTAILMRLQYVGEQFIRNARQNANFKDQTGNLRSSIGYIVLENGKRVSGSTFDKILDAKKGPVQGKSLIRQLRAEFSKGFVLIVVAGMEYAAAVESRGKDVLTASSIIAKNELKNALNAIQNRVNGTT
jgi:hypothetical protein